MSSSDLLNQWSMLSWDEIEARLQAGEDRAALSELVGDEQASALEQTANQPSAKALYNRAVVLLPGVMGSLLMSVRGVTNLTWINPMLFARGQGEMLELNDAGDGDRMAGVETVAFSLEKVIYSPIALALRKIADLYEFPYDWRKSIEYNADLLASCLERWTQADPGVPFTLVGHSMGGLVSRACLARHPQLEQKVNQVITMGTPQFGSPCIIQAMLEGNWQMDIMRWLNKRNDPSRLVRNIPSAYQVLPPPPESFPAGAQYPSNWDLYNADAWDTSGIRQDYLDGARRFHQLLAGSDPQLPFTQIAGCNMETVVALQRQSSMGGLASLLPQTVSDGAASGDDTVPLWSAAAPGAGMYYVQESHQNLPRNKQVIRAVEALVKDGVPDLPDQLPPRQSGWFNWRGRARAEDQAEAMRQRIESGRIQDADLRDLYFAM